MRIAAPTLITATLLAMLTTLAGCMTLHADLPEDVVRRMSARKDGIELGAFCAFDGRNFSEGAVLCMAERSMSCDGNGRWVEHDTCHAPTEDSSTLASIE